MAIPLLSALGKATELAGKTEFLKPVERALEPEIFTRPFEDFALTDFQIDPHDMNVIENVSLDKLEFFNRALVEKLEGTRNQTLEGKKHPETGVRFERDVIILEDGTVLEEVFPKFEAVLKFDLPREYWDKSDSTQTKYLNEKTSQEIQNNPDLQNQFSERQLEQISNGDTPEGYTWHHHQQPGRMELVNSDIHSKTGHTGGRCIWCEK